MKLEHRVNDSAMAIRHKSNASLFVITSSEIDQLYGMVHLYQLLYFYLRSKMDKQTGLIGSKEGCRISLAALAECIYVEPGQGLKNTGSPTIKQIRVALNALQRKGLIELRSIVKVNHKQLIIYLPLAQQGYSAQNKVGTFGAHKQGRVDDAFYDNKTLAKSTCYDYYGDAINKDEGTSPDRKEGAHQEYNNNSLYIGKRSNFIQEKYHPGEQCLAKIKQLDLFVLHTSLELEKFINYYKSKQQSCKDWDSKYICWLINAKQYQLNGGRQDVSKQRDGYFYGQRRLSAVDRVRQRNQIVQENTSIDVESHYEA